MPDMGIYDLAEMPYFHFSDIERSRVLRVVMKAIDGSLNKHSLRSVKIKLALETVL
jgi:hypothetical protein